MKLVFLINYRQSYRYYSSLINVCFANGCKIELWHDYSQNSRVLDVENTPFFNNSYDGIVYKKLLNKQDLMQNIRKSQNVDYFISHNPVTFLIDKELLEIINGKWCIIMHGIDSFAQVWHWQYFGYNTQLLQDYDRFFFPYTGSFYKYGLKWLKKYADRNGKRNYEFFESEKTVVHPIGCTMYDKKLKNIDKKTIRNKYKISPTKGLLIYLPFPFDPSRAKYTKNGSYAWQAAFAGIYISGIKSGKRKGVKIGLKTLLVSAIKKLIYLIKIMGDKEAQIWLIQRWNEPSVFKAIRRFCDNNNLLLVVKPRKKFSFSEDVYRFADIVIDDDESQHYPSKLQELFSIADLAMGYFTTAVIESVLSGVSFINIECPGSLLNNDEARMFFHRYYEGSMYNYKGIVKNISIPQLITEFGEKNLNEFNIDSKARKGYMEKYTGLETPTAAERFFEFLERKEMLS